MVVPAADPIRDPDRLAALYATGLLDAPAPAAFDRLTRLAARLLAVPEALVTLIDADRQFIASRAGDPEVYAYPQSGPLTGSFCRHVVARGRPLAVVDAREDQLLRDEQATRDGTVAYAGVPLFADGKAIGSFCIADTRRRDWTEDELGLVDDLAAMGQSELDVRAASREAGIERDMLEQLTALTDTARDAAGVDAMLHAVCGEARRLFGAAAAAILLIDPEGDTRRRAGVGLLERPPSPTIDPGGFAAAVLESDAVVAVRDLHTTGFGTSAVARAGVRAALGVPLVVSGRTTGFMIVGDGEPRDWTRAETQLLGLTGDRIAAAVEREEGHDNDRAIADTLQRALLPTSLPRVDGLRLAARYEPAENRIGGDWYDAFELADGRLGLAIGDVVGHGIVAAAAAVRMRHFLRGAVLRGLGPGEVLATLNRLVGEEPEAAYSSMLYLELDPATGWFRWAGAGHLPPALVGDGSVELLPVAGGSLLGVMPLDTWPEGEDEIALGERLVLYTDGLVERPGADVDALTRVLLSGAAGAPSVETLADALVRRIPAPRRDDVAVLVAGRG